MKQFVKIPDFKVRHFIEKIDSRKTKREKYVLVWQWIGQKKIPFETFPFFCEYIPYPKRALKKFIGNDGKVAIKEKPNKKSI
jgi:hypothetical protein